MRLNRARRLPITQSSMRYSSHYVIPDSPPAELLAELDAAARVLDELTARAAELTLGMDEQTRSLRIELLDGGVVAHARSRRSCSTCSPAHYSP